MRCPACGHPDTRVLDSRPTEEGAAIRRRRECPRCRERFTTYERVEHTPLWVVKKDGRRELFNPDKVLAGVLTACEKRPVSLEQLQSLVREVERELRSRYDREVPSREIGELVMERLRALDDIAYVRFASVYREFRDLETLRREVERLLGGRAAADGGRASPDGRDAAPAR